MGNEDLVLQAVRKFLHTEIIQWNREPTCLPQATTWNMESAELEL